MGCRSKSAIFIHFYPLKFIFVSTFCVRRRLSQCSVEMISIHPSRCTQWLWENVRQPLLKEKCQNLHGCQLENRIRSWYCFQVPRSVIEAAMCMSPIYLKCFCQTALCVSSASTFKHVSLTIAVCFSRTV